MVIKASSRTHIEALVADLASDRAVTRESAISRLTVMGARAVERLIALARDRAATAATRAAALRALESLADPRALDAVIEAIDEAGVEVPMAAIGAARVFLRGPRGVDAVDRLTRTALDRTRLHAVRITALGALSELEPLTLKPLYRALAEDPDAVIAALASHLVHDRKASEPENIVDWLTAALDAALPDDPAALRRALAAGGGDVPLPLLHRLVQRVAEREAAEPLARRKEWTMVRGAAHVALAARDSRLALYDLRETLASATEPVPVEFLAALRQIGDASCLEPLAAAYAGAAGSRTIEDWWLRHLTDAFRTIVSRTRMTRRHAVMKRIEKRWPAILDATAGR